MYSNIVFVNPGCFYLFIVFIPLIVWYIYKLRKMKASLNISSTGAFQFMPATWRVRLRHVNFILRCLALAALIIVLTRPQIVNSFEKANTEGIDIVMAIDVSSSMLAEDLKPTRLAASKQVASEFVNDRPNDRIGLVIFAGEAFTQCPLTTDHKVLLNLINDVNIGFIEDGTAIGLGLATAVNRLKDSDSKSRVVILLTDGSNNAGNITPVDAAHFAQEFGIRVYTIGVGSKGPATLTDPYTGVKMKIDADIDEAVLKEIATLTDGEYFRATDNTSLKEIYKSIDQLEKRHISVNKVTRRRELYFPFALAALCLVGAELILRRTVFRTIP